MRKIYYIKDRMECFIIYDKIEGKREHKVSLRYHLSPDLVYKINKRDEYELYLKNEHICSMILSADKPFRIQHFRGKKDGKIHSIISEKTNKVTPSTLLELTLECKLPLNIVTIVSSKRKIEYTFNYEQARIQISYQDEKKIIILN